MGRTFKILSQSGIWRCNILIFIIVGGVVEFDFSRLIKIVDELCMEGIINAKEIKAQIGHSKYEPKCYNNYRFVDGEQFHKDIENADVIITHGGVGTLVHALKLKKKVIIFPRLQMYKEHLDNHQLEISKMYNHLGYCMLATNKSELKDCIKNIENFSPKSFISNNSKMIDIIISYLDSL